MNLLDSQRLILKIGSRLLIDNDGQHFNMPWLVSLIGDVADLVRNNTRVIIVTSGSVAAGNMILNMNRSRLTIDKQQASAAVGQIQLIHTYQTLLAQQGIKCAQILLTMNDIEDRRRYINLCNTVDCLMNMGVIPIINENDSTATAEIRYGDNDRLAARVVQMVDADTLVLLSDVDGLYTNDPSKDKNARFIDVVQEITPEIEAMAKDSGTHYGSGGMKTKIAAARIAMNSGARLLICKGRMLHPVKHFIETGRGTWFMPRHTRMNAKKSWLRGHLNPKGKLIIDAGAAKALTAGKSLLPVGVIDCVGRFAKGDPVSVFNERSDEVARGLTNYSSEEIKKIMGHGTEKIETLLNYHGTHEIIHCNNLVVLNS